MNLAIALLLYALTPTVIIATVGLVLHYVTTAEPITYYRNAWRRRDGQPVRSGEDLPRPLAAMSRLDHDYVRALATREFAAQAHQVRTIRSAYDQALTQVCAMVGLAPVPSLPLRGVDRVRLEGELRHRGLRW